MTGLPAHIDDAVRFKRHLTSKDLLPPTKGEDLKPRCRWCDGQVPKGRRSWCSEECVDAYLIRSSGSYAARKVHDRDHGVCAICGLDTDALDRWLHRMRGMGRYAGGPRTWRARHKRRRKQDRCRMALRDLRRRGYSVSSSGNGYWESLWQADHIVPVCEGGGCCGLENLRTLCQACHKRETAELARRRAEQRDPQATMELEPAS